MLACVAQEVLAPCRASPFSGAAADVFACGVALFVLVVGYPPFQEASPRCWCLTAPLTNLPRLCHYTTATPHYCPAASIQRDAL